MDGNEIRRAATAAAVTARIRSEAKSRGEQSGLADPRDLFITQTRTFFTLHDRWSGRKTDGRRDPDPAGQQRAGADKSTVDGRLGFFCDFLFFFFFTVLASTVKRRHDRRV